jgi:hypothetical protein
MSQKWPQMRVLAASIAGSVAGNLPVIKTTGPIFALIVSEISFNYTEGSTNPSSPESSSAISIVLNNLPWSS